MKLAESIIFIGVLLFITAEAGPGKHDHHGPGHDNDPRPGHDHQSHGPGHRHDHGPSGHHDHGTGGHHDHGPNERNRRVISSTLNPSKTLEPGRCTKVVRVTITVVKSYQASRRIQSRTKCGWLHLAHCKKYRLGYHLAYRQVPREVYAEVSKCCPGYMEVDGVCEPLNGRTMPPTPPPSTVIIAPADPTTSHRVPDDDMMMMDDKVQKVVSVIIVLIAVLTTGFCIGGVVVYMCGGQKEVMRRISTRKLRKTRKAIDSNEKDTKETKIPDGRSPPEQPPRYDTMAYYKKPAAKPSAPTYNDGYEDLESGVGKIGSKEEGPLKGGDGRPNYLEFHAHENPPVQPRKC